jgi:hypothetical protein
MTYFPDLGALTYFGDHLGPLTAVGWLDGGHDFTRREVTPAFFERLFDFLLDPWQPVGFLGSHACDFCWADPARAELRAALRSTKDPAPLRAALARMNRPWARLTMGGRTIQMGNNNVFVPGEGCVYSAPSMVAHYIDAHGYGPPDEFIAAVLRCPDMQSEAYRDLCSENGDERVVRGWPGRAHW